MEPRGPGYIKLTFVTPNAEDRIVRAARNSYHQADRDTTREQDESLMRYMYQNKHTSPFEFVHVDFQICAPLSIVTQLLRHRTGSFNVMSHRYSDANSIFKKSGDKPWYSPVKTTDDIRMQSTLNRQSSSTSSNLPIEDEKDILNTFAELDELTAKIFDKYNHLLKMKVGKEIARFYLPCGTYTIADCSFDLHNLLHFLRLRRHDHAQLEIQEYANELLNQLRPHVPFVIGLFEEEMKSITFNAQEVRVLNGEEEANARVKSMIDDKMSELGMKKL
jgi:thymidylate synthase (FAD)